jgi:hypothetical protein
MIETACMLASGAFLMTLAAVCITAGIMAALALVFAAGWAVCWWARQIPWNEATPESAQPTTAISSKDGTGGAA